MRPEPMPAVPSMAMPFLPVRSLWTLELLRESFRFVRGQKPVAVPLTGTRERAIEG